MTDQAQVLDPQQDLTIEPIAAQEKAGKDGKDSEQSSADLIASLEGMGNADLLALVEQAYREDPEANRLVIQKATELLDARGQSKQVQKTLQSVRSESWRDLLGQWLGGELYELIADKTNEEALLEAGKGALTSAINGLPGLGDSLGLDASGADAVKKLAEVLAKDAVAASDKLLASDKGKALIAKISRFVDDNPGYVLALAVLAAAGAVAADVDIPKLKANKDLGKGFSVGAQADLGSIRHIALEAAKLDMQYVSGKFKANASVAHDKEKGTSGEAAVRYGDKDTFVQTSGSIDPEGNLIIGLNAALKQGLFSGSVKGQQDVSKDTRTAHVNMRYGDDQRFLASDLNLDTQGFLTTKLTGAFTQGLFSSSLSGEHKQQDGSLAAQSNMRYGDNKNFLNLDSNLAGGQYSGALTGQRQLDDKTAIDGSLGYKAGQFSSEFGTTRAFDGGSNRSYLGTGADSTYTGNNLKYQKPGLDLSLDARDYSKNGPGIDTVSAQLGLKPSDLASVIVKYGRDQQGVQTGSLGVDVGNKDLGGSLGLSHDGTSSRASASGRFKKGDLEGSAAATYNLTTSQIEDLSVKLGFRDPKEFRAFSIEFSRSVKEQVTEHQLSAMFETQLGQYMLRGQGTARFTPDNTKVDTSLLGARYLNKDVALIAGASASYDNRSGNTSITPQVGVQYKGIPITVGYDFDSKAVTVGLTIPFGR